MDTTETPGRAAAVETAVNRSEKEFVFASTRTMFASGAVAWAHSTSSDSSTAQPALSRGSRVPPVSLMTLKLGGAGKPKVRSNVVRSELIRGALNASTMAMVWPAPLPTMLPKLIWSMP